MGGQQCSPSVNGRLLLKHFMLPKNRKPTHPGIILLEDFLKPTNLTQIALAEHLRVPVQRINEIVKGKRGVTPETAWLFAKIFSTTPEFWLNLQVNYDLYTHIPMMNIVPLKKTRSVASVTV